MSRFAFEEQAADGDYGQRNQSDDAVGHGVPGISGSFLMNGLHGEAALVFVGERANCGSAFKCVVNEAHTNSINVSFQLTDGAPDGSVINGIFLMNVASKQAFIAQSIHEARNSFAVTINPENSGRSEIRRAFGAGDLEAVGDVAANFAHGERPKMVSHRDALAQLPEGVLVQAFSKFGLAHEDDLQKLAVVGFEIGEEADLLEQLGSKILGFVDNEHGVALLFREGEEVFVEGGDGFEAVQATDLKTKFHGDGFDELVGTEGRVKDKGGFPVVAELFEEGATNRGFAGPDFTGELDEPLAFADPVKQVIKGFAVFGAVKEEAGVGGDVEGGLLKAVIIKINQPQGGLTSFSFFQKAERLRSLNSRHTS